MYAFSSTSDNVDTSEAATPRACTSASERLWLSSCGPANQTGDIEGQIVSVYGAILV